MPDGRVLIAFDDTPQEPNPTWTRIDDPTSANFPQNFVAGYDTQNGKQTLLAQTDTGTGLVYIYDNKYGLFDPRNASSPYYQKLDGKQIMLQLWDPVREVWEQQFQGTIDFITYEIDPQAVNAEGQPINATLQVNCVDVFDYCAGFGLTPGLAGVKPPRGAADGVYYAETVGNLDDRIIEILADIGIDESRYVVFSGNVRPQAVKYDPNAAGLTALRDAADAEFPFISNLYVDRFGRLVFHGRYGRLDTINLAADTDPSRWDFHSWRVGDGKAIQADMTRAQMRVLNYDRGRENIINVASCWPQGILPADMPGQVYADVTSIDAYGAHAAPPMSDLILRFPIYDDHHGGPTNANDECFAFAELLVKNQKDPRESITALQLKTVHPLDGRAENVWPMLTQADVSDMVNVAVGYPGGTGFTGSSPADEYFIEGRTMRVRPLDKDNYDYVELDLAVSPFVWSADTHGVFPARSTT